MKVRVLLQRAILRAIQDSASTRNTLRGGQAELALGKERLRII
jgi:hypothetical protein